MINTDVRHNLASDTFEYPYSTVVKLKDLQNYFSFTSIQCYKYNSIYMKILIYK